jgi:hypothetical protein
MVTRRTSLTVLTTLALGLLMLTLASCADLPPLTQAQTTSGDRLQAEPGVSITALNTTPQEWAEILGIERWHFAVSASEPDTGLRYQLELEQPEQQPQILTAMTIFTASTFNGATLIAMQPIGQSLYHADQVRYYLRSGGSATSQVAENPVQGWSGSMPQRPATLRDDGAFELMVFSKNGQFPHPDNAHLILRFSTAESPSPAGSP